MCHEFQRKKSNYVCISLLFILVGAYKLARSQFSLSASVNRISIFIVFLNYLLDDI